MRFTFSKNILNPGSPHFAYFTRPDYFGMITADNQLVYNLDANTSTTGRKAPPKELIWKRKSVLTEALR
ncbi:MAG: hypothetical protein ACLU18_11185 [Bacteroides thetaiotaomicron]